MKSRGLGDVYKRQEQGLADGRYPLMCVLVEIRVYWLPRPKGDVVEVNQIVARTAIDQCPHPPVADGHRFFKILRRLVVPQSHGELLRQHRKVHDEQKK